MRGPGKKTGEPGEPSPRKALKEGDREGSSRKGAQKSIHSFSYPEVGVPFLWPLSFFEGLEEAETKVVSDNLSFLKEVEKTQVDRPKPGWATPNVVKSDMRTMLLRDFSGGGKGTFTLVVAPYAGHTSTIVDFHSGQSLVEALMRDGVESVAATDWKSATEEMKDLTIDDYLTQIDKAVDELGGKVNLAGMCQGGWISAMYASRFPEKVNTLVLAGSPIDTHAGTGRIRDYARRYPIGFFEELVSTGDGLMKGDYMLEGFKSLHPAEQYFGKYAELYEHIEDPSYVKRFESFERWYEYTINLPGRWYLQVIRDLFKGNKFFKGEFVGLGKKLSLGNVRCPVFLLAGKTDDITPPVQVFNAEKRLGTEKTKIEKMVAEGGHIGLFMGSKTIRENWPTIAKWIKGNTID
jgi:polyhydroxyalkanoate depolymerase